MFNAKAILLIGTSLLAIHVLPIFCTNPQLDRVGMRNDEDKTAAAQTKCELDAKNSIHPKKLKKGNLAKWNLNNTLVLSSFVILGGIGIWKFNPWSSHEHTFYDGNCTLDHSPYDEKGYYIPKALNIPGVPEGYCFQVDIEKQDGLDCMAASSAYTHQRGSNVPDKETRSYRREKYKNMGIKDLNMPKDFLLCNREELRKCNLFICSRHIDNTTNIITGFDYSLICHGNTMRPNYPFESNDSKLVLNLINRLVNTAKSFKNQKRTIFVPYTDCNCDGGVSHRILYEIKETNDNPLGFKIICYDSLRSESWRIRGAGFLYKIFSSILELGKEDSYFRSDSFYSDVRNFLLNNSLICERCVSKNNVLKTC